MVRNANLHFADEPILIDRSPFLTSRNFRRFSPHLLHVFQYHVAMSIECLDSSQEFSVVST